MATHSSSDHHRAIRQGLKTQNSNVTRGLVSPSAALADPLMPRLMGPLHLPIRSCFDTLEFAIAGGDSDSGTGAASSSVVHVAVNERSPSSVSDHPAKPFAVKAEDDYTGQQVWPSAIILAKWLCCARTVLEGRRVCELGAGCGLPGLTAAVAAPTCQVVVTDYQVRDWIAVQGVVGGGFMRGMRAS